MQEIPGQHLQQEQVSELLQASRVASAQRRGLDAGERAGVPGLPRRRRPGPGAVRPRSPASPLGWKLPGVRTPRWVFQGVGRGGRECLGRGAGASPTSPPPGPDACETTALLQKRADGALFPRRAGVGVHPKAPRENKKATEKMCVESLGEGEGGVGGRSRSVLIGSGQRENPQVCRKITSFPVPIALACDSCFLGDSKTPGFS